eukprot:Sspe_Gene.39745::Locus_19159_Transcript_1_1_Confidence_1.000_Length_1049::g.39745::m.39745
MPVTTLLSPPAFNKAASQPYCLATDAVLALTGIPYKPKVSVGSVTPVMAVMDDDVTGIPTLVACRGDTPAEGFDEITKLIHANGAPHGPVAVDRSLSKSSAALKAAYKELVDTHLAPAADWLTYSGGTFHRSLAAKHTSFFKWLVPFQKASFSARAKQARKRLQEKKVLNREDAVQRAWVAISALNAILKEAKSPWILGTAEPSTLDCIVWGYLVSLSFDEEVFHLHDELEKAPHVRNFMVAFTERLGARKPGEKHALVPTFYIRPVKGAAEDTYRRGRLQAQVLMTATVLGYVWYHARGYVLRLARAIQEAAAELEATSS